MCLIIKNNVPLNEITIVPPTAPSQVHLFGPFSLPVQPGTQSLAFPLPNPKYNTTLDYSVTPFDHPVLPYLTIRRPCMPSDTPQDNEIPIQLPSALHFPLLKRRIALNATIVFCNLFWGIRYVLFRFPSHLMCRIPLPTN